MKQSRFVQLQNPISEEWVRVDTHTGNIVGHRSKPYKVPIVFRKSKLGEAGKSAPRDGRGRFARKEQAQ